MADDAPHQHQHQRLVKIRTDKSAGFLLRHAARLFDTVLQERLKPHGSAAGQYPLLLFLWERDGVSESELGARAKIAAPTLVRTLDRMEEAGLIRRRKDAKDRRSVRIHLTVRGRGLQSTLLPVGIELEERALGGLEPAERQALIAALQRLIANLER